MISPPVGPMSGAGTPPGTHWVAYCDTATLVLRVTHHTQGGPTMIGGRQLAFVVSAGMVWTHQLLFVFCCVCVGLLLAAGSKSKHLSAGLIRIRPCHVGAQHQNGDERADPSALASCVLCIQWHQAHAGVSWL